MLTGTEIRKRIKSGEIEISPFLDDNIGPNSVDLRLNNMLMIHDPGIILDMKTMPTVTEFEIPPDGFVLRQGELYLGSTVERTSTPTLIPCVEGRSSVGRLGINIHATAGFGDIGFNGTWTLEISVIRPVRIYPFVKICQVFFQEPVGEIKLYNSDKYQYQTGPRPSGLWREVRAAQAL